MLAELLSASHERMPLAGQTVLVDAGRAAGLGARIRATAAAMGAIVVGAADATVTIVVDAVAVGGRASTAAKAAERVAQLAGIEPRVLPGAELEAQFESVKS